jgi:hypothetical protein
MGICVFSVKTLRGAAKSALSQSDFDAGRTIPLPAFSVHSGGA